MPQSHEEWLKERKKGIGSSDVAALLGVSPFKSNIDLWEEKVGLKQAEDISDLEYVRNGTLSEAPLRELFKIDYPEYEVSHEENEMMVHPKYNFIRCSPDSLLTEKSTGRKGFLEIKRCMVSNGSQYLKWKNGSIPEYYYTQTLQYFLANPNMKFGYLRAYIIRYSFDGSVSREVRDYKIADSREEIQEDLDYLLPKEIEFWECVEKHIRPARILPSI